MGAKRIGRLLCVALLVVVSLCLPMSVLSLESANQGLTDSSESALLMGTGGHTQEEAVAWTRDRANESWSQDVDGVYGCQCVDLIKAYYRYLGNSYVLGNACDYQHNALPAGWYRDNTPSPGAVAVWAAYTTIQRGWDTDQYGHVGIVVEVNGSTLKTVETNAAWRQYARYLDRPAGNVTCFIHPDFSAPVPHVDFSNWEDGNYTYVRETDAAIGQNINVSGGTCTDTGICLYDINGNLLADCANGYYTSPVCFWINRELGYTLTPATTYKYKFYAVVNGQTYWSNEGSFTTIPSEIHVDFSHWENENYTYVRETDAAIGQNINVSGGTCTDTGICLYDINGNLLANCANGYYTSPVCFWINQELGYTLTPATTYKYKFYAVVNGQTYWSNEGSFTTTGQPAKSTCVVTFVANNGTDAIALQDITDGDSIGLPACAFTAPSGKQFKAWRIRDSEYSPGSSYTVTGNTSVLAIWEDVPIYDSPQIAVTNKSAPKGLTVDIPVVIKNNPGISGATLITSYDKSVLTLKGIIKGSVFANGTYAAYPETGVMQWYHTENVTEDGALFTLQFEVNENASNGNYTIAVGVRDGISANLSNADSEIVDAQFISGVLEIAPGVRGDVTGDGVVAINDVVKVARAVAGSLTLTEAEKTLADVTGDGVTAINDVVKLARYVAGSIASLQSAEIASLSGGESAVIEVATVSGTPGGTVRVPVSVTSNPGIAGAQLDVLFDSGLTLKNIIQGDVLSAGTFNPDISNGRIQWYYDQANVTNTGVLLTLEFEISANAKNGDAYAVTVNVKDGIMVNLSDYDSNPVNAEFQPGRVQIGETSGKSVINTVSRDGNSVTVNVVCADSNASVFCGVYNNSGKMIAVRSVQVTSESTYQFQFDGQQFDYAKAFILDSDFRPLCESART